MKYDGALSMYFVLCLYRREPTQKRGPSTKHKVQSTKYKVQNTKFKAPPTKSLFKCE